MVVDRGREWETGRVAVSLSPCLEGEGEGGGSGSGRLAVRDGGRVAGRGAVCGSVAVRLVVRVGSHALVTLICLGLWG